MTRLILPRNYTERPALNLAKHAFRRQHKGVLVFGTWLRSPMGDYRPCLAFGPANVPVRRWEPCVVRLDGAWLFTEEVGDPDRATVELMEYAEAMGWNQFDSGDLVKILSAIRDCLADLKNMPAEPPLETKSIGDAKMVDVTSGRVVDHQEVTDRV